MKYLPDLKYIPDNLEEITSKTLIAKGVPLSTFLANTTLDHLSLDERKQIIRNLMPQAQIYKTIRENQTTLASYGLRVVEGVYKPFPDQELTPNGPLDLASKGRRIVYEVMGQCGVNLDKSIEAITYISIYKRVYDNLILDYDTFSPDGSLNVQIIIECPEIDASYNPVFKLKTQTLYNNNSYGQEFVKMRGKTKQSPFISENTVAVDGEVINEGGAGEVKYVNQGATRRLKLTPALEKIIIAGAEATGYNVEIFSGGQDGSTGHVGSNRHNNGYAADVWVYRDGRRLNTVHDAEFVANFVKAVRQAGAISVGAGRGYMDDVGIHVDIAPGNTVDKNSARCWGANGAYANAPSWLKTIMA